MWGILPLFLYKNMKRLTSRGRSQDQDSKLKKFLNYSVLLCSFLIIVITQKSLYNVFSILIGLGLIITILLIPPVGRWIGYFLKLDENTKINFESVQTDTKVMLVTFIIFLISYLISTSILVKIPGLNAINEIISTATSGNNLNILVSNIYKLVVIFGLSNILGFLWSNMYVKAWKSRKEINNVAFTEEQKQEIKDQQFLNGYLLGLFIIRLAELVTPIKRLMNI